MFSAVLDSSPDVQWTRLTDLTNGDVAALQSFAGRVAKLLDGSAASSINGSDTASVLEFRELRDNFKTVSPAKAGAQVRSPLQAHANLDADLHRDDSFKGASTIPLGRDDSLKGLAQPETSPRAGSGAKIALAVGALAIIGLGGYYITQNKTATPSTRTTSTDTSKPGAINPLSVMVMPFNNQTGDKEKGYIADALTSSITSDLTRIRDAFIVPAATAFSLRDKQLTVPQLGKEAAVRFVLTGSVTGDKEKLRINAVPSDTQTGAQLWTENFDGKQSDLFALKDQVTTRIGNTIGPKMIIVAARDSEKRASTPQVADLLMRANALDLNQQSLKNRQAMEALYRQALALEPDNLNAQIGLASSLALQASNHGSELKLNKAGQVALAKQAADLAKKVKQLDPNDPRAHGVLGTFARLSGALGGALRAAKRRVELEPRSSSAHSSLGMGYRQHGDMPGARGTAASVAIGQLSALPGGGLHEPLLCRLHCGSIG